MKGSLYDQNGSEWIVKTDYSIHVPGTFNYHINYWFYVLYDV